MELKKYTTAGITFSPNYKYIPVNIIEDPEEWNEIYRELLNDKTMNKIVRTNSGGISITRGKLRFPCWDLRLSKSLGELTILAQGAMVRLQFRPCQLQEEEGKKIYGNQAFKEFARKCLHFGIDLNNYLIDELEGTIAKSQIQSPLIKLGSQRVANYTWSNTHHIDFHSSFPAGLVNTHPEFKDVVKFFYDRRKSKKLYKAVLNYSIGFMQSQQIKYRLAHLSRDAINDNNKRVKELAQILEESGRMILAYNTDGIWYTGEIYHGDGEGTDLGEWSNDHVNCIWRAKSAGSYEFIENEKYTPVVRGKTNMDYIKARENWEWGDIYHCGDIVVKYVFEEGVGFIPLHEKE